MRFECSYSELVNVSEIIPHPKNCNIHSEKQIDVLAKIIDKNGQRSPIVISKRSGYIVKGHGRLDAIKKLGWEKCAVDYQNYESDEEEFRDRIADNEIARYAEFDQIGFTEDLKNLSFDLQELSFEEFGLIDFKLPLAKEGKDYSESNKEIDVENFGNDLKHTCPKCGFDFND